jgi:hypothetical protein
MEAESHEPEAQPAVEDQLPKRDGETIAWANIFYGMIVHPVTTLKVLVNPDIYKSNVAAFAGVLALVLITSVIESFAQAVLNHQGAVAMLVTMSLIGDLLCWLVFSVFLAILLYFVRREIKVGRAFIACGWAFVPLIFKAPIAACAVGSNLACSLLGAISTFWFILLQLFAYDALLKSGRWKTIALTMLAAPVFFAAWMCWFLFGFVAMVASP